MLKNTFEEYEKHECEQKCVGMSSHKRQKNKVRGNEKSLILIFID